MRHAAPSRIERRKERTRHTLLAVALELFCEKGIYWTKIEEITDRADIGKGTFYQYFETKEELLEVLLSQGLEALLASTRDAVRGTDSEADPLKQIVRAQLQFYVEHKEYLLLFHQVRGLLQLTTESVRNLRRVYDTYLDRLGKLIEPALCAHQTNGGRLLERNFAMTLSAYTLGLLAHRLSLVGAEDVTLQSSDIQSQLERSLQALI